MVHLDQGRLLASLEGGTGRRLEIVSPGAVTDVVGTLFSVEVVGDASRVAVAHGRVQVSAAPGSSGAPPRAPREIAAGQSWLTTLPEPDGLEPALAEALADHERTPPPRGATVPLSVTEAPAGGRGLGREAANRVRAGVGARRAARRRPAVGASTGCGAAGGSIPAAVDGAGAGAVDGADRGRVRAAGARDDAGRPRPLLTPSNAEPTEPPAARSRVRPARGGDGANPVPPGGCGAGGGRHGGSR